MTSEFKEVVRGHIRAWRVPSGNIEIDTTHTAGGLIRSLGLGSHVIIERADLDDAIEALQAIRCAAPEPRPIERYVRASAPIPGYGCIAGTIEIGLHRDRHEQPSWYRAKLIELAEVAARRARGRALDEDTADAITEDLDARIVGLWGDRPRFIEVWLGTTDAAEVLTQVYAPHGMPRQR